MKNVKRADVQWKGTNLCMDWVCAEGHCQHLDDFTFGFIECVKCGLKYEISPDIKSSIKPSPTSKKKEVKTGGYLGKWHMGHVALFGAMLMSKGIVGQKKESLKKIMYEALTTKN